MRAKTPWTLGNERGNLLVITILILFAISVIGASIGLISSMDLKIAGNQRMTTRALPVAEAGLNEAIHRISLSNPTNATIGGWTGNIAIGDREPYNPNWQHRLYLTGMGAAPGGSADVITSGTIQDPTQPYLPYSEPNGAEGVLTVEHKWRDRDGDGARDVNEVVRYDALQVPPENFTNGFPVELVTVTGRAGNGQRTIQAEVTKRTMMARTLGALYTDKAIKLVGNCAFCGYNHDVNTPVGRRPNGCVANHLTTGHLPGVTTTGDNVQTSGSSAVAGSPLTIDKSATNPWYTLAEVLGMTQDEVNEMLSHPDYTSITSPMDGITYIQGDAAANSNFVGSGLLYVTGDLSGNGNFVFRGLIYVEGDLKLNGTAWILGSVIVKGKSDFNFSAGNGTVLYSKDAITQYLSRAMPAILLSWREM